MAKEQQVVVCARMEMKDQFPDNQVSNCACCGAQCVHRPHYAEDAIYVCMDCGAALAAEYNLKARSMPEGVREYEERFGEGSAGQGLENFNALVALRRIVGV